MKQLILFRHAKSSWDDDLDDVDRPLAPRGERDAPRMGKRLKARHARPGLILASHAVRAQQTAKLVARALGIGSKQLATDKALYLASPDTILTAASGLDDAFSCVLLVGHNPGLTELVNLLLPGLGLENLPTSGVVAIDFAAARWKDARRADAKLAYYDYPKNPELFVTED